MMKVFRIGGGDPRSPQWWVRASSQQSALEFFCESVVGVAWWHEFVAVSLMSYPDRTYYEFLSEFMTEEPDRKFSRELLRRVPRGHWGEMLLYQHGPLELFRIGAYERGCWILACDLDEALRYYGDCVGDIQADYRTVTIGYAFNGFDYDEVQDEEWLPDVIRRVYEEDVCLIKVDQEIVCLTGVELIQRSITERKMFPRLVGYSLPDTLKDMST